MIKTKRLLGSGDIVAMGRYFGIIAWRTEMLDKGFYLICVKWNDGVISIVESKAVTLNRGVN